MPERADLDLVRRGRHPGLRHGAALATGLLDGRPIVVSGSSDRTIRVWDLATGASLPPPVTGHTDLVFAVVAVEDAERSAIVSGSRDTTVRVWRLAGSGPSRTTQPAPAPAL